MPPTMIMDALRRTGAIGLLAAGFLFILPASAALAAEFRAGENYALSSEETIDGNLYVSAGTAMISGTISGDLVVMGGEVFVDGMVEGDVLAVGGTVYVSGNVEGDIRVVGGEITVEPDVAGDLLAVGGVVLVHADSIIGGDLTLMGGRVVNEGTAHKDARIYGGNVTLNGPIAGNITVRSSDRVVIGEAASLSGVFSYAAPRQATIHENAVISGDVFFEEYPTGVDIRTVLVSAAILFVIIKALSILLGAVLAVLIMPRLSWYMGNMGIIHFGRNLAVGLAGFIVLPVLAVLLLASLLGVFLGLLTLFVFFALVILSSLYAGVLMGALLARWFTKGIVVDWKWTILGVVVLTVLAFVPVIGWAITALFFLLAFGTALMLAYEKFLPKL